jgi:hypothetical protein
MHKGKEGGKFGSWELMRGSGDKVGIDDWHYFLQSFDPPLQVRCNLLRRVMEIKLNVLHYIKGYDISFATDNKETNKYVFYDFTLIQFHVVQYYKSLFGQGVLLEVLCQMMFEQLMKRLLLRIILS